MLMRTAARIRAFAELQRNSVNDQATMAVCVWEGAWPTSLR
jgi:hypothetical protein